MEEWICFDMSIISFEKEDLVKDLDAILSEYAPEGKTIKDFTGGYIQQLTNSNVFVAYYGTDKNKNKNTVRMTIPDNEVDLFYVMLKAKIHEMKYSGKTKKIVVSLASRKLGKK